MRVRWFRSSRSKGARVNSIPAVSMLSRRRFLALGAGAAVLAACGSTTTRGGSPVRSTDAAVERRDALRRTSSAHTVSQRITAAPVTFDLAGKQIDTWAFGDRPGSGGLRATAGDLLELEFVNRLTPNTLHWHGIALRNDMDGVHDLTQSPVPSGSSFTYRFTAPDPGTYWFHPHMGLELDRGLYAPLIIEDPHEPLAYDVEHTLMLDDWLDGFGRTQEEVLAGLQTGGGHSGHMGGSGGMGGGMSGMSGMGGLTGDVAYPLHIVNGRAPADRETVSVKPGQRLRLRLINAGSDTAYRFAVGGHRLTVTHADGFAVDHVEVDNVVLAMGERVDVLVTVASGTWPMVAVPEGKTDAAAEAVLRTTDSAVASPPTGVRPAELNGRSLSYNDLKADAAVKLSPRRPDRSQTIALTADGTAYRHGIDGRSYPDSKPIQVREGERLRLHVVNNTMMFHPMHLHGHTFEMVGAGTARKDTVIVLPMQTATIDIQADNPGQWMMHCHNTYHFETGMATVLSYVA